MFQVQRDPRFVGLIRFKVVVDSLKTFTPFPLGLLNRRQDPMPDLRLDRSE